MSDVRVVAVSSRAGHGVGKTNRESVRLITGLGVEGDAHFGATVRHRSRVAKDPTQPNLRQVHLVDAARLRELGLQAGVIGENITTAGIDLLGVPRGTRLRLGNTAVVEVTGLRNPCKQLEKIRPGLMQECLERRPDGELVRKAGVMAIVIEAGEVRPGDSVEVHLPAGAHHKLEPV